MFVLWQIQITLAYVVLCRLGASVYCVVCSNIQILSQASNIVMFLQSTTTRILLGDLIVSPVNGNEKRELSHINMIPNSPNNRKL